MGVIARLFKKPEPPQPYDWPELRKACLRAIDACAVSASLADSELGELDYDRLGATGDDAEEVVVEIWMAARGNRKPDLTAEQTKEYLYRAAEILKADIEQHEAVRRLKEMQKELMEK